MKKIILPENHISLASTVDIVDICKPLFNNSPIAYFCWFKMFDNGFSQLLISNSELPKFHLNTKSYLVSPNIEEKLIKKNFSYLGFNNLNDKFEDAIYNYKNLLNIHHPIYLFERHEDYYESFWFATDKDNAAVYNFYLNQMDMLENFKLYFKDKARSIIQKTIKNQLLIPEEMQSNLSKNKIILTKPENIFNTKRYQFKGNSGHSFTLSRREMEVIQWLARGCTLKEVAKILQLSPRTIEQHFNSIKNKSGLERKSQIIDIVIRL